MSQDTGPTLAHRSVASIRSGQSGQAAPSSPHTPPRTISSTYGSPSTIRAEEDILIVQPGSRFLRAGFAGEPLPKATLQCGPDEQRRVGDFRQWLPPEEKAQQSEGWAAEREFWKQDLRDVDLGLVQDKLDRMLREAFSKYLLIDSKPRRIGLVLDSGLPLPLLSTLLDVFFNKFQSPIVSLLSSAVMTTVGAGVRSGLVIDIGWEGTTVTSVYEYREVKSTRSVRGGRRLLDQTYKTLCSIMGLESSDQSQKEVQSAEEERKMWEDREKETPQSGRQRHISFEECEEVMYRLMWCRSSAFKTSQKQSEQLETVEEQDESELEASHSPQLVGEATVPFSSISPPREVQIPLEKLADTCDDAFFSPGTPWKEIDDEDLPLDALVYQHLLQLPVDTRAVCMARTMFTGGCANVLGLKERVFDEVTGVAERRGWDAVTGKAVDQLRSNSKLKRPVPGPENADAVPATNSAEPTPTIDTPNDGLSDLSDPNAAIEAKLEKHRPSAPQIQGELRALHSVGPWAGASLVCQLKAGAIATIEREQWLLHGIGGASRPGEVDHKQQQRQSMGGSGMWRGAGSHQSWTLGTWGYM